MLHAHMHGACRPVWCEQCVCRGWLGASTKYAELYVTNANLALRGIPWMLEKQQLIRSRSEVLHNIKESLLASIDVSAIDELKVCMHPWPVS